MVQFTLNAAPKPSYKRNKPTAKQRGSISPSTRLQLAERSNGRCERCGRGGIALQGAHLVRRWKIEGKTTVNDLAHLCEPCHRYCDNTAIGRQWLTEFKKQLSGR